MRCAITIRMVIGMQRRQFFTVRKYLALAAVACAGLGLAAAAYGGAPTNAGATASVTAPASPKAHTRYYDRSMGSVRQIRRNTIRTDIYGSNCEIEIRKLVADALVYVLDNEGRFPGDAHRFAESIAEDSDAVDPEPAARQEARLFNFNTRLTGVYRDEVRDPAHTVLVYEGVNEHLIFRHNAHAIVAFVDGHVEELCPQRAAMLRWNP